MASANQQNMKRFLIFAGCMMAGLSMMSQDNLMAKANEGNTGDKAAMANSGWECWNFPYTGTASNPAYGTATKLTWDSNGPSGSNVRWENSWCI